MHPLGAHNLWACSHPKWQSQQPTVNTHTMTSWQAIVAVTGLPVCIPDELVIEVSLWLIFGATIEGFSMLE